MKVFTVTIILIFSCLEVRGIEVISPNTTENYAWLPAGQPEPTSPPTSTSTTPTSTSTTPTPTTSTEASSTPPAFITLEECIDAQQELWDNMDDQGRLLDRKEVLLHSRERDLRVREDDYHSRIATLEEDKHQFRVKVDRESNMKSAEECANTIETWTKANIRSIILSSIFVAFFFVCCAVPQVVYCMLKLRARENKIDSNNNTIT